MSSSEQKSANAFLDLLRRLRPELELRINKRYDDVARRGQGYGPAVAAMVESARDLALRGGKRVRAGMLAAGWLAAGGDEDLDMAVDGGVAFELFQTYLLIQDDWMDGDLTRRGGPSVHAALAKTMGSEGRGASSAILASDLTWGLAVETFLQMERLAPETRLEALTTFVRVHEDVVIGQQLDILADAKDAEVTHDLKTGSYTIRGPLILGAVMAKGSSELKNMLTQFAQPLGVAFQLRDDLLGTFGDPAETGKPVGNDILVGKRTALIIAAEKLANDEERRAIQRALGRSDATERELEAATAALISSGARRSIEERQAALCAASMALLESTPLVPPAVRPVLTGIVEAIKVVA